jgi:hypothetical protein
MFPDQHPGRGLITASPASPASLASLRFRGGLYHGTHVGGGGCGESGGG